MSDGPDDPQLTLARIALERGDYGQVIRLLGDAPPDPEALLLLATAQMGLGQSGEALLICRRLRRCADAGLRAQARELQRVLEAPTLKRPREWSLTLPALGESDAAMGRQLGAVSRQRRRRGPQEPPPPAVGPTRAPLGFALVVMLLMLLALALGGCGRVQSSLTVVGPGRLQISHQFQSDGSVLPSWQQQLGNTLRQRGWQQLRRGERTVWLAPPLPSRLALAELESSVSAAMALGGLDLPPPQLQLRSRNWLVAVDERLSLEFDLRELPGWANAELDLLLVGLPARAVRSAAPAAVIALAGAAKAGTLCWSLQGGSINHLDLHFWRWSPLGLGAVVVVLLLLLSLVLQQLRRQLGFGLPGLPG